MLPDTEEHSITTKPTSSRGMLSWLKTFASLALFIAVDYLLFKSWISVVILVSVIVIHESGHFIAMKLYGYKEVRMTFIPFMGAYVSGESSHFSRRKKLVVLFAGPIPGILLGILFFTVHQHNGEQFFYWASVAFLALNTFNLLPVSPLDGGQILDIIFARYFQVIQLTFLLLVLILLLYFLWMRKIWLLLLVGWMVVTRIRAVYLVYRVRRALNKKGIDYDTTYDELTNEHYAKIRDVLVESSPVLRRQFIPGEFSNREASLISYLERILATGYDDSFINREKAIFLSVYLAAFILPLLLLSFSLILDK